MRGQDSRGHTPLQTKLDLQPAFVPFLLQNGFLKIYFHFQAKSHVSQYVKYE